MNITLGQSAKKQHFTIGSRTACNRRTSMPNGFESFKWWLENYPNACCHKCLKAFQSKK
jgi:hypothetical protein